MRHINYPADAKIKKRMPAQQLLNDKLLNAYRTCDAKSDLLVGGGPSVREPCYASCSNMLKNIGPDDDIPANISTAYKQCVGKCDRLEATPREKCHDEIVMQLYHQSQSRQLRTVLVVGLPIVIVLLIVFIVIVAKTPAKTSK